MTARAAPVPGILDPERRGLTIGLVLTGVAGTLALAGDTVRIERLTGKAGPGTLSLTGSIGVLAPGLPVDGGDPGPTAGRRGAQWLSGAEPRRHRAGCRAAAIRFPFPTAPSTMPGHPPTHVAARIRA